MPGMTSRTLWNDEPNSQVNRVDEEEDAPREYASEGAQRAEAAFDAGGGGRGAACSAASISSHACMAHESEREANERERGGGQGGAQLEHQ